MKKIIVLLILFSLKINVFAESFLWKDSKLKSGTMDFNDIPDMLTTAIDSFFGLAVTISVVFIIIWAYKILLGSLSQDKTKWRDTILAAIFGFILSSSAWFIVRLVIDNFG